MNKNSDIYSFLYAAVMVIIVAGLLASVALGLKPKQQENIAIEKMQNILAAVNVKASVTEAEAKYKELITKSYIVDIKGNVVEGDAFKVNVAKEAKKSGNEKQLPVYEYTGEGTPIYIVPIYGGGMWGPIWGYVALKNDKKTIYGAMFDHQGETPGLGAEIATPSFFEKFPGKAIFDQSGSFTSVSLVKGGAKAGDKHGVDAISGGTVTSVKLSETLSKRLGDYQEFFKK